MKRVLTFMLIFLSFSAFAVNDGKTFLDANFNPIPDMLGAKYYRTVSEIESDLFYAEIFYLTDSPQMKGHYLDKELTILHGLCSYFHRNGRVESTGDYDHGKRIGVWNRFTLFGEEKSDRYYPSKEEIKAKNKLKTCLASFKSNGKTLSEYIRKELIFPKQAELLEIEGGFVNINLSIDKSGAIEGYEILHSTSRAFTLEAEKVISSMPSWIPAFSKGNAVSSNYIIKIQFGEQTKREDITDLTD